jgi:hypothetical protein
MQKNVESLVENGKAKGYYNQGSQFEMTLDKFSLKNGQVEGKGNDSIGDFIISGTYNSDWNIHFVKQYIGQHSVDYEGKIIKISPSDIEIRGKWEISSCSSSDDFFLTTKIN